MKTSIVVGLALVLGVGLGVGGAVLRVKYLTPWYNKPQTSSRVEGGREVQEPAKPAPKLVLTGSATHDFGVMDSESVDKHVFEVRNEGNQPLRLHEFSSTCKCTVSMLGDESGKDNDDEQVDVLPGKSINITVEWKTKGFQGDFLQTAIFKTNDMEQPELTLNIKGRVLAPYVATPPELVFSGIPVGEEAASDVKVLGYLKAPFEVAGVELTEAETAKFFEVTHEPLPAEEIAKDKHAKNGRILHVTVKPGLPSGQFRQKILLKTGSEKDAPSVEIPVNGVISSELSIIGSGWNDAKQILSLGAVSTKSGTQRTIRILARGPHRKEVKLKPIKVVPDLLEVSVGEMTDWQGGQITQTLVTISVPKGSRQASYLGPEESNLGQITLETDHPNAPQLRILVRFAVVE